MRKLLIISAVAMLAGCTLLNTFQDKAGRFLATTATLVDGTMKGYAQWVVVNNVSDAQQAPVKAAYQQYQSAMLIATNAYVQAVKFHDSSLFTAPSNSLVSARNNFTSQATIPPVN